MPNWCSTTIQFTPKDGGNMDAFMALLEKVNTFEETPWFKKNVGFPHVWLGSIAMVMGYEVDGMALSVDEHTGEFNVCPKTTQPDIQGCRGYIEFEFDPEQELYMGFVESAWAPPEELIDAIEEYCSIDTDWIAYEPGCEVFVNSNLDTFPDMFVFETENDTYYPVSEKELLDIALSVGVVAGSYEELKQIIDQGDFYWSLNPYTDVYGEPWYLIKRKEGGENA